MDGPREILQSLALVLCLAAVTTVVFQRLHQPVVVGYLLAGLLVGPNVSLVFPVQPHTIEALSELGVILLMFSLGLEFSLPKLLAISQTGGVIALIEVSLMMSLGYVVGQGLGLGPLESVFAGALIAISSTTIVARAFAEQKVDAQLGQLVFGTLIAEDLLAVLLITVLTAIAKGTGLSAGVVALTIGRLLAFLVTVVVVGLFIIPRSVRFVIALRRPETTVVACVGIGFAIALLAQVMGYSVALGAFLAGSLVGESGEAKTIERVIEPVRDVFAAIFFVSVGMLIDPHVLVTQAPKVLVLAATVIFGKLVGVSIGAFFAGNGVRDSVRAGLALAQIGEFSFIIAALGLKLGATGGLLSPVAVAVSVVTTLLTPGLIARSERVAGWIEHALPKPVQTFAELYGAWIARLRERPHQPTFWTALRRTIRLVVLDVAVLIALIIGTSISVPRIASELVAALHIAPRLARALIGIGALFLSAPFIFGLMRLSRSLGVMIAQEALPSVEEAKDTHLESTQLLAAPPRALVLGIQLAIAFLLGAPILAVTGYFLPSLSGALILTLVLGLFAIAFVRSTTHLEGQLRAGTEMVVDLLSRQRGASRPEAHRADLESAVQHAIPWFGVLHSVEIVAHSEAKGQTLADLSLRGRTGASVVAIRRGTAIVMPTADEALRVGDILALTGSDRAVAAARLVLGPPGGSLDDNTDLQITKL